MPAGAPAGHFVDQPKPGGPAGTQGRIKVGDTVAHMMNAGTPPDQELGDRTVGGLRCQQLDVRLAKGQRDDRGPVGRLGWTGRETQDITVKGQRPLDAFDGDADMGDDRA